MRTCQRQDNLDLLKAIAILMVLSLHVPLWNVDFINTPTLGRALQYAARLVCEGVPLFLVVNGYLLFGKDSFDLDAHLKKMARLFLLTVLWSAILAVAGLGLDGKAVTPGAVFDIMVRTRLYSKYTGVLWYMQSLLGVYLLFPALRKLYEADFRLFKYLFFVVAAFTLGLNTLELCRDCAGLFVETKRFTESIAFLNRFNPLGDGWYLFYFMLGGMFCADREAIEGRRALLGAVGIASVSWAFTFGYLLSRRMGEVYDPTFNYGSPFMLCFIAGLLALTLSYRNDGSLFRRFIASVGQNTFGIYLSHFLFIFLIERFFMVDTLPRRAAAFATVFVGSWLFSVVVRRIPGLKKLVGG